MYKTVKIDEHTYILSDEPIKSGDVAMISNESDINYGYVVVIGVENTDPYMKVVSTSHPDYKTKVKKLMKPEEIEILESMKEKMENQLDKERDKWFKSWMKDHTDDGVTEEYMNHMKKFDTDNIDTWKMIANLGRVIRRDKTPKLEPHNGIGDIFPIEKFKSMCEYGGFMNSDGYGEYATESQRSDIEIHPSDFKHKTIRTDFTHVVWYNK